MIEPYASGQYFTIYHGDALAVLPQLPSGTVDLVIADPPYSSGGLMRSDRSGATSKKYQHSDVIGVYEDFAGDNKDQRSHLHWSILWLGECLRLTREGRVCGVWSDWRQVPITSDALQGAGWVWRGIGQWDKTLAARPRRGGLRQQAEYLLWGSRGGLIATDDLPCLPGSWQRATNADVKDHVAAKPFPILLDLVTLAPVEAIVLDPFAGSGTTGDACIATGRHFVGVELVEYWAEVTARRLEAAEAGHAPSQFGAAGDGQLSLTE